MRKHTEPLDIIPCSIPVNKRFENLSGKKFGRLLVINLYGKHTDNRGRFEYFYECLCDCGQRTHVHSISLKAGSSTSCGCFRREINAGVLGRRMRKHGMYQTSEYRIWQAMLQRCENSNAKHFKNYGGRGIKVCERWHTFEHFYSDVGPKPKNQSINRLNNNGNYEPENCCWSTQVDQCRNTRSNRMITHNGETHCCVEWDSILGFPYQTITRRLHRGWSEHRALTQPQKYDEETKRSV